MLCALLGVACLVWLASADAQAAGNATLHLGKTVAAGTFHPTLGLTFAVDRKTAIPADRLTYTATVTNEGATVTVTGDVSAGNTAATTATIASYWDNVDTSFNPGRGCNTNHGHNASQWRPFVGAAAAQSGYTPLVAPPTASGMTLSLTPIPAPGVTYPASGDRILNTKIASRATASWRYVATIPLTVAQDDFLIDHGKVTKLRNTLHVEVTPRRAHAQPAYVNTCFAPSLFGTLPGTANNVKVTITPPTGSPVTFGAASLSRLVSVVPNPSGPVTFTSATTPALASLAPGESMIVKTTYQVPAVAIKGESETDAEYLARLASVDGSTLTAAASATATASDGAPLSAGPVTATTTEHVPILEITKSGPKEAKAGTTATYELSVKNLGGAEAHSLTATDVASDGTLGTVTRLPPSLGPDGSGGGKAALAIPVGEPCGPLADTASVVWTDANGNSYGPVSSSVSTTIAACFSGSTLTLAPSSAGPAVTGTFQTMSTTFDSAKGTPIPGQSIVFEVTGANPTKGTAVTDSEGVAKFTYKGDNTGTDSVVASFTSGSFSVESNKATVSWVTPIAEVSTTSVTGRFYSGGCGSFCADVSKPPLWTQSFPTIDFNPPGGTIPGNITGVGVETRPFTDITTNAVGDFTGATVAKGNGFEAGVGSLFGFDAVFTANFVAASAGNVTFHFYSDDGFIFGAGGGAERVSGAFSNPPTETPLEHYPVMGAYNQPTAPVGNEIVVHFPKPGTYPYEADYSECCGGQVALTMGGSTGLGVPPAGNLSLTPVNVPTQTVGQPVHLTVAAMDASGHSIPSLPVTMTVSGVNSQTVTGTTDSKGIAVLSYTGTHEGGDLVLVGASVSGAPAVSNTVGVVWQFGSGSSSESPPPLVTKVEPEDGLVITQPTPIKAKITPPEGQTIESWKVTAKARDPEPEIVIASGERLPKEETLGTLDTTVLANDTYEITVSAKASGGGTESATTTVAVQGNYKPGRYVTTYQDLSVPVNGFQMNVRRVYDSIDKRSGDFGFGWHVELANFRVSTNRELGAGDWTEYPRECIFGLCFWNFKTSTPHYVTITFPDGHQEIFDFTPEGGAALLYTEGTALFTGRSTNADPKAKLEPEGGSGVSYQFDGNLYGSSGIYNPTRFKLTERDGAVLVLDVNTGLVSETDRNGNSLTVDSGGVHASSGQSITFTRDPQGRITKMTGPSGQSFAYTYSEAGDLASSTDPNGNETTYSYDAEHHLEKATGPGGHALQKLTYEEGRLKTVTDANGNTTTIDTNVGARQQTEIDPNGKLTTIYTYDELGDVVQREQITEGKVLTTKYTYDSVGRPTGRTDPLGHTYSATYDSAGNLSKFTAPSTHSSSITYDENGDPLTETDPLGHKATYAYDSNGNLTSVTDPLDNKETFTYDSAGHIATSTNRDGKTTTYSYDAAGDLTFETDPLGNTTRYTYDTSGNLTSITDPLGHTTTYAYDSNGNLISKTDPLGRTTTYTYDEFNRTASETDPAKRTTRWTYTGAGQLASTEDPARGVTSYTYDADGKLASSTDPLGHTTHYAYNGREELIEQADPLGRVTSFAYDEAGNQVGVTDPAKHTTHLAYDAESQLISSTDPIGKTTTYSYDAAGNPIGVKDPLGRETTYSYDSAGHKTSETDQAGHTTEYAYDPSGLLTQIKDALGGTVKFSYDADGRRTSVTEPDGNSTEYEYDAAGNLTKVTDPLKHTTLHSYDAANEIASTTDGRGVTTTYGYGPDGEVESTEAGGQAVTYSYDSLGRRASMTDATGTTKYTYDGASDLTSVAAPAGAISYTYDAAGQRATMTLPGSRQVTYGYDAASNLTSIKDWLGKTTTFSYDADGRQTAINRPNGVNTSLTYDAAGQILSLNHDGTGPIVHNGYSYDAAGNRTSTTTAAGTSKFSFDPLNRLTGATYPNGDVASYMYDAAGNRTSATLNGKETKASYNAAGELTSNGTTSYTYDGAGDLLTAGSSSFSWDPFGHLRSATVGGATTEYTYNGDGLRASAKVGSTATPYLWDTQGALPQLVDDGTSGYVQANGVQEEINDSSNTATFPLADALGSVQALTSATGGVIGSTTYDAFGNVQSHTGSSGIFGFAGQQTDATGLQYLRARYLDPSTGRFISSDSVQPSGPATSGYNLYTYVGDNPTRAIDPSGHGLIETGFLYVREQAYAHPVLATIGSCIAGALGSVILEYLEQGGSYHPGGQTVLNAALGCTIAGLDFRSRVPSEPDPEPKTPTPGQGTGSNEQKPGEPPSTEGIPGSVNPYSGALISVPSNDPDAIVLAQRISGVPSVKFANDPTGREFDAISDEYIGQAKPDGYTFNSAGRNQAKATFDAAKATGRNVYYHFDGPPGPGVIAKLNEYSARYGVLLVIDTKPF